MRRLLLMVAVLAYLVLGVVWLVELSPAVDLPSSSVRPK